eukprot:6079296-Karenia_brevis.AAC.1
MDYLSYVENRSDIAFHTFMSSDPKAVFQHISKFLPSKAGVKHKAFIQQSDGSPSTSIVQHKMRFRAHISSLMDGDEGSCATLVDQHR